MLRKNLFYGDSAKAHFVRIAYRQLMSRRWVTYADVLAEYMGLASVAELKYSISKYYECGQGDKNQIGIKELKKAFPEVCRAIKKRMGNDSIITDGNNRAKRFCYIGQDDDPLSDMRNAKVINDLRQYWKFCQDSAGFFPKSWLEYFFKDCQDLLDIKAKKQNGYQVISASVDRILTNIEYLPFLYEAITNKQVLEVDYKPFDGEMVTFLFHPHYLKEYNGRWYLFGHADGRKPDVGYNIALDRIQTKPREKYKVEYIASPAHFYDEFFKDIIGVSHIEGNQREHIVIHVHTLYMYKLIDTKPIHPSYALVKPFGKYDDGEYAEFSIDVEVNNELIGHVLQMGAGLEVIAPVYVRDIFKERVQKLATLYQNEDENGSKI